MSRLLTFTAVVVLATQTFAAPASGKTAALGLKAVFAADWEWRLANFPPFASSLGDPRYANRLTDYSTTALQQREKHRLRLEKQLAAIPRNKLSADDQLSYDLFRLDLDNAGALQQLHGGDGIGEDWTLVSHLDGVHLMFSQMVASTRFENEADYRNYLARLRAFPNQIDQVITIARKAQAAGWSLPRVTVEHVPQQVDKLAGGALEASTYYQPFVKISTAIPPNTATALVAEARNVLNESVIPALHRLKRYMIEDYIPRARESIAASDLPNGRAYYKALVRQMTTSELSPEQIHQTGLMEVARIARAIEAIAIQQGSYGPAREFIRAVRARPDQYFASSADLLAAYEALGKRIDPLLPRVVKEMPRLPWGIRVAPAEQHGQSAEYIAGAADGSRAGYFILDTSSPATMPKFEMTALLLHEAVPGHHLQVARAQELNQLPSFRRHAWYTAYGEGWALYAESLGEELGLYDNPLDLLGRYTYEIWRAARLVVDTGIHAKGWSRQQAIDYLQAATGDDLATVTSEIDRYIAWPGQALGYKIGELTIRRLRTEAEKTLGTRFDRRAFHNLLLDAGPLPLTVLETRVNAWIRRNRS